jgi:SAM-dependent methyltransferase
MDRIEAGILSLTPAIWFSARGKGTFVLSVPPHGRVLDVGCGNNSPQWCKTTRPDLYYVGIDIGNYNQAVEPSKFADEYVVVDPSDFAQKIGEYKGQMDAVISSHNLEHCDEPDAVILAMLNALKPGGRLYLSFPSEASVSFPHRDGCLNFYDDTTHKKVPSWKATLKTISDASFIIEYAARRYRPFWLSVVGLILEARSARRRQTLNNGATWALYGFESVIWARARAPEKPST